MYPWLRLIRVVIGLIGQPKLDIMATTRTRLRVWPNDLDLNLHVNNGRYLALADLARTQWVVRTGLFEIARRHKSLPIVGDAMAKFRRDLKVFQTFEIQTRLLGWDQKWGLIEHRFVREGRVIGVVVIRGIFKGAAGTLDPSVLMEGLARTEPSPDWPGWASRFHESSELLTACLREEERAQGLI